jgi:sporulation protein YlmC with PRC-barrel domain
MRKISTILLTAALGGALVLAVGPQPVLSQAAVALIHVDVKAVAAGYRASKLSGQNVINDKNEKIGTLDDLIVGKDKVLFAVLQVGGFLGLGGHLIAVPYQELQIDDAGKKITLPGASKDELKKLPEFTYET